MGIRGGGRICRSLDTLDGHVTSPPYRKERPARGSHRVQPGAQEGFPGAGESTYPEELLELGAVVERGDVHSEAKQVLSPLSSLLDHRGFKPACGPQDKGQGEKQ